MAHAGWDARGLLRPLWNQYEGGRDGLAEAVGTQGSVLSSINSGKRPLGHDLAGRLGAELGVSLAELGAPEEAADAESRTLHSRLEGLEDLLASVRDGQQEDLQGQDELRVLLVSIREMIDARLPVRKVRRKGSA